LRRWLEHNDNVVTFVRNVTDVDDKIIHNAGHEDVPFWLVAQRVVRSFNRAYDVLGCLPPTVEPRATGHIPEMIELIARLIEAGHAYAAGGDVYFKVRSYDKYGALSGQRLDDMLASPDEDTAKLDPHDFALWKGAKEDEPYWNTPWGPGRPGWHIECSAMAEKYLGGSFDIHGGGLDLIFPHHENEIAQSKAAGDGFANYWLHNAWVTTAGEKMSKSLGNSLLVSEVVQRVRPIELRYYLVSAHYRSMIEFSEEAMQEAGTGFRRLVGFLERAVERVGVVEPGEIPDSFRKAMDDDLSIPAALAVVHEYVTEGNKYLTAGDTTKVEETVAAVRAMLNILGVDPMSATWDVGSSSSSEMKSAIDALVAVALDQRKAARERKDYAAADSIRDQLAAAGIAIEDTPEGPRWSLDDKGN
jgi:cysteinyl-tRNA synthetase